MTKNKPIYHAWDVHRWKGFGKTSTFHRFTNPRRDKSIYFWSLGTHLLYLVGPRGDVRVVSLMVNGNADIYKDNDVMARRYNIRQYSQDTTLLLIT